MKDDIHIICANTITFPLPTQGDKVEVSHNGNDFINIREYRALADSIFICKNEHGKYEVWQYIRPIEVKEERSEFRELAERLDRVYKIVYKYVNGINPPKTDKS